MTCHPYKRMCYMATPPEGKDKPAGETDAHARETTGEFNPILELSLALDDMALMLDKAHREGNLHVIACLGKARTRVENVKVWIDAKRATQRETIREGMLRMGFTEDDQPALDLVSGLARAAQAVESGTITETQDKMDLAENRQSARDIAIATAKAHKYIVGGKTAETRDKDFVENAKRTMASVAGKLGQCMEELREGRAGR